MFGEWLNFYLMFAISGVRGFAFLVSSFACILQIYQHQDRRGEVDFKTHILLIDRRLNNVLRVFDRIYYRFSFFVLNFRGVNS